MPSSPLASPPPGPGPQGLDDVLSLFVPGQLSEIVGPWSSGGGALLMALLARATASGGQVALVDGADAFDAPGALIAGVDLSRLLWVRCGRQWRKAWMAMDLLANCPGFALVALDLEDAGPAHRDPAPLAWGLRLRRAATSTAAILVLRAPRRLTGSAAALVVGVRRLEARWSGHPHATRLEGLRAEARVLRAHPPTERVWHLAWRR